MLESVAPIYRTLIYEHLSIKSLVRLSETCKTIHNDSNLKEFIMKKIINKFGYRISQRYWSYINYDKMNSNMLSRVLVEFIQRTINIDFISIVDLGFVDKRYLTINIPNQLYLKLSIDEQIQIVDVLCGQLYRLYEYANQRGMRMNCYDYRCAEEFDLYPFYDSIKCKLKSLFLKSNHLVKHKILGSLNNIQSWINKIESENSTSNQFIDGLIDYDTNPDPQGFINGLCDYDISKLETIIEIGLFLEEYYCDLYLTDFLESNIEYYIDVKRSYEDKAYDDFTDEVDKILDGRNKIYPEKTNGQILKKLIRSTNITFIVQDIYEASKKRRARFNGEDSDDSDNSDGSEF